MLRTQIQQLYHTFRESFIDQGQILVHQDYHQQLYHTFLEPYIGQEHI